MWVPSWDAPLIRTFWKSTNRDALTSNMKRRQLLQLADCRLEWEGEGEEREGGGRGDKWGEMEDKKGGMERGGRS